MTSTSPKFTEWKIAENGQGFQNGDPATGMVTLSFYDAAKILAHDAHTRTKFLSETMCAFSDVLGDNHPLVIGLKTLSRTQFPLSTPSAPCEQTSDTADATPRPDPDVWGT